MKRRENIDMDIIDELEKIVQLYTDSVNHDEFHITEDYKDICQYELDQEEATGALFALFEGTMLDIIGEDEDHEHLIANQSIHIITRNALRAQMRKKVKEIL